jgi:DNA polymerase III subunit alpha
VSQLDDSGDGTMLWTGGIVANAQKKVSKNGGVWLAFRLEDVDGGAECRAWPATYEQYKDLLHEDAIIKVKGRVERKSEGETTLIAVEVLPFSGVSEYRPLTVTIDARRVRPTVLDDLKRIFADFPGQVPVVLHMVRDQERARLRVGDGLRVAPVAGLYAELKALLGESCVGVG